MHKMQTLTRSTHEMSKTTRHLHIVIMHDRISTHAQES
jgi:hypothetical protein